MGIECQGEFRGTLVCASAHYDAFVCEFTPLYLSRLESKHLNFWAPLAGFALTIVCSLYACLIDPGVAGTMSFKRFRGQQSVAGRVAEEATSGTSCQNEEPLHDEVRHADSQPGKGGLLDREHGRLLDRWDLRALPYLHGHFAGTRQSCVLGNVRIAAACTREQSEAYHDIPMPAVVE